MRGPVKLIWRKIWGHIRIALLAGLLVLVPVVISYLVLRLLFNTIDGVLQPGIDALVGRPIPGLGIVLLLAVIYVVGLVSLNVLGRRLVRLGQGMLLRVPIVKTVYSASKQLIESFSGGSATGFKRVVAVEYPRVGSWTIGFLTNIVEDENGQRMALVYIPTAPTPQTGWVAMIPAAQVYDTNLTVPQALNLVLSGGIVAPAQIKKTKAVA